MDSNAPILDYASPRKRVRLRMPARSKLTWRVDRDEAVVQEVLQGKSDAIHGIIFACLTLSITIGQLIALGFFQHPDRGFMYLPALLAVAEFVVMLMVIHQTWRKTQLIVRCNEMLLTFSSPFRRRDYRWTSDDIADILLVQTANVDTPSALAELLITRCVGGDVHLFTDHLAVEIKPLVATLPAMFRKGEVKPLQVE